MSRQQDSNSVPVVTAELRALSNEEKRKVLPRFFKTGKGEYGEGDRFLGVTVPNIRQVAKRHAGASLTALDRLLASPWHEVRMCALLILVEKTKKATAEECRELLGFYLDRTRYINNWDLVDLSAPAVVGGWLLKTSPSGTSQGEERQTGALPAVLESLANSPLLWDNRIAVVSTLALIRNGRLDETYTLALLLMRHEHDLMHKAIGWMLREAGKRDHNRLFTFVEEHRHEMPRTMLRYAIERFDDEERKYLMS